MGEREVEVEVIGGEKKKKTGRVRGTGPRNGSDEETDHVRTTVEGTNRVSLSKKSRDELRTYESFGRRWRVPFFGKDPQRHRGTRWGSVS